MNETENGGVGLFSLVDQHLYALLYKLAFMARV